MFSSSSSSLSAFSSPSPSTFGGPLLMGLDSNHTIQDTPIEVLSAQYTAVQNVLELNRQLIQQSNQANQALHATLEDSRALRSENKELLQRLRAQSSLQDIIAVLSGYDKPAKRPAELPQDVLWTWDDMKADPEASPPAANPSRPAMNLVIRSADGTIVDSTEFSEIKSSVHTIYNALLQGLTPAGADRPLTRYHLRKHHRSEWDKAIHELEETHPVVGLCSYHWKAEQLFQQHISSLSNAVGKREKKLKGLERTLRTTAENSEQQSNPTVPVSANAVNPSAPTGTSATPPAHNTPAAPPTVSGTSAVPQRQASQDTVDSHKRKAGTLVDVPNTNDSKKMRTTPNGASSAVIEDVFAIKPTGMPMNPAVASSTETTVAVNVSHIRVSPTLENLAELFATEFSSINEGVELMKTLKHMSGKVPDIESSPDVKTLYSRIESADPNSPDISADDTNAGWGHYQFTAGSLTIDSALVSWTSIGSVDMACRLVAASIKTRRIAVQICAQRRLHPASYLSDVYLARVVEKLLELAKTVQVPEPAAGQNPQGLTSGVQKTYVLKDLLIDELKTWITDNSIPVPSGRIGTLKKQGLIDAITTSGKIPANDDFEKLISSRRRGKKALPSSAA